MVLTDNISNTKKTLNEKLGKIKQMVLTGADSGAYVALNELKSEIKKSNHYFL